MSFAGRVNLQFDQGSTWTIGPFQLLDSSGVPVPISAVAAKMRQNINDAAPFLTFTGTVNDAVNGIGQATATAAQTAALSLPVSSAGERDLWPYFYDVDVTLADTVTVVRILDGVLLVSPAVDY